MNHCNTAVGTFRDLCYAGGSAFALIILRWYFLSGEIPLIPAGAGLLFFATAFLAQTHLRRTRKHRTALTMADIRETPPTGISIPRAGGLIPYLRITFADSVQKYCLSAARLRTVLGTLPGASSRAGNDLLKELRAHQLCSVCLDRFLTRAANIYRFVLLFCLLPLPLLWGFSVNTVLSWFALSTIYATVFTLLLILTARNIPRLFIRHRQYICYIMFLIFTLIYLYHYLIFTTSASLAWR
ncbi:MAG: hypothetical protein ACQEQV_07920 [Fibrobacterota bacterium]